ncbi:MAG: polyisoprenoid-binding protein YceI [Sphingobacteriales bacterium]|jgi:polyisoprenoid-binding protein YceI
MRPVLTLILLFSLPIFCFAQRLIPYASYAEFEVGHLKFRKVEGKINGINGEVKFNAENLEDSRFHVCLDARKISTDNEIRDAYITQPDIIDVNKYPEMCFKSTEIVATGRGHVAKGKLTLNGVSKNIEIPFVFKNQSFIGRFAINRFDFDIADDYSTFTIDDLVKIQIVVYTVPSLN